MKEKKLYMIGNAHIDPVWMWRWQEGFAEIKATFRSALDRMKEYDDFIFTGNSASFYEWVEENDPQMFEEIRERVKEGRWVIVGGWWIQPDCNTPSGESFVRQGLYGQRYFQEKLGVKSACGYNVDSFGHNGMLPQILKKSGMDSYVFMRPGRHEKGLPGETFLWKSLDGSEVTAARIPFEYCTWPEGIEEHVRRCAGEIKDQNGRALCFYGVGNHGGGPTRKNIESIRQMQQKEELPKLIFSSPADFFAETRKEAKPLPTVTGELLHHASGCYSAHSGIKRWNRMAENRLEMAEKYAVVSDLTVGKRYPGERLTEGWKEVLFNQFHDILAGTCLESAYQDAQEQYGAALSGAAKVLNSSLQTLSWKIDIPFEEGTKPLVVFNPNAFETAFEVAVESWKPEEGTVLLDEAGEQVPFQYVQSEAASNGRCRMVFVAKLPSLGWRTFRFAVREDGRRFADVKADQSGAENKWFSIRFDERTGYISSLRKKNDGTEYFSGPAAVPVVMEDKSDTWSHGVRIFDKRAGEFTGKVSLAEQGPVKSVFRVTSTYGASRIVQDYSIYQELDFIVVKTMVDWREQFKMLKFQFPMNMNYLRASWEIPYGSAEREPDGEEYPMQNFIDLEGTNPGMETHINGLSILNDGKASGSVAGKTAAFTVLRSPVYANHEPYVPDEGLEYTYLDQGIQNFTWVLYPHDGSWEEAGTVRLSKTLNQNPISLFETFHAGELQQKASFLKNREKNVCCTVVKEAEDGSGDLILRFYETAGKNTKDRLELRALALDEELLFSPFEIKTVRVKRDGTLTETNMLEECRQN